MNSNVVFGGALLMAISFMAGGVAETYSYLSNEKYRVIEPKKEQIKTKDKSEWITKYVYDENIWEKIGSVDELIILRKKS